MKKNLVFLTLALISSSATIKANQEKVLEEGKLSSYEFVASAKTINNKTIMTEISIGDLFDKISILDIKLERITDSEKLINIKKEFNSLLDSCNEIELSDEEIDKLTDLYGELKKANENLWEIEDKLRELEANKDFGEEFVSFARNVYYNNDKRCEIKREINILYGSNLIEEKSYNKY